MKYSEWSKLNLLIDFCWINIQIFLSSGLEYSFLRLITKLKDDCIRISESNLFNRNISTGDKRMKSILVFSFQTGR